MQRRQAEGCADGSDTGAEELVTNDRTSPLNAKAGSHSSQFEPEERSPDHLLSRKRLLLLLASGALAWGRRRRSSCAEQQSHSVSAKPEHDHRTETRRGGRACTRSRRSAGPGLLRIRVELREQSAAVEPESTPAIAPSCNPARDCASSLTGCPAWDPRRRTASASSSPSLPRHRQISRRRLFRIMNRSSTRNGCIRICGNAARGYRQTNLGLTPGHAVRAR